MFLDLKEKIRKTQKQMVKEGVGGILTDDVYFLGGIEDGVMLIPEKGRAEIFISPLSIGTYEEFIKKERLKLRALSRKTIVRQVENFEKVGVDEEKISAARLERFKKETKKTKFVNFSSGLQKIKSIKTNKEIEAIRKANERTKEIIEKVNKEKSEVEIKNDVEKMSLQKNYEPGFFIVAAGKHSSFPHHFARDVPAKNKNLLIDAGVRYKKYWADVSRCFNLREKQKREYEILKEIFWEIVDFITIGASAADVQKFAQKILSKKLKKLPHAIGHGVGTEIHEAPFFYEKSKAKIERNIVFAIEPALYRKNYGLRYENVLVMKNKPEIIDGIA